MMYSGKIEMRSRRLRFQFQLFQHMQHIERTLFRMGSPSNRHFMNSLPDTAAAQDLVIQGLNKKQDFLLIRFGLYEYQLCLQFLEKENCLRRAYSQELLYHLPLDTGLFGLSTEAYDRYAQRVISSLNCVDILSYWRNFPSPYLFSQFYSPDVRHINVEDLYPYPFWHGTTMPTWQSWLVGKRILVVSSFADTIKKQYARRTEIWSSQEILPQFSLIPYQAVQTNGGSCTDSYSSWEDSLQHMVDDISRVDFDLALISCGGYGMPLAIEIHGMGKRAIQWGGCSQLWFGILGGRWDRDPKIVPYINSAWTYPSEEETPPLKHLVAEGSYWKTTRSSD